MIEFATPKTSEDLDFSQKSYLLVDDERFSRSLIKTTLSQIGGRNIFEANNADEAIQSLKSQKFDVILLDHLMPDMTGLMLCRSLRAGEYSTLNQETPIILITADVRMETVMEAKESQINDFLVKPISYKEIEKRLIKVLFHSNENK